MLKSHTLPGHWQQEGRICCRMEAEMGMARWHYRFNDYYDEGCVINPQAEQIKLSACKCHLMRVCVCCACKVLQCCWWWAFYFRLKEVTFLLPFSASVMFLFSLCSLSIRNPPHACFFTSRLNHLLHVRLILNTKRTLMDHRTVLSKKALPIYSWSLSQCLGSVMSGHIGFLCAHLASG